MTISDLIEKLTALRDKHGDNNVTFRVRDDFKVYGVEMTPAWGKDDKFWAGTFTNGNHTSIEFHIADHTDIDGETRRIPLITFRKPTY
jgi:hypothetical protein